MTAAAGFDPWGKDNGQSEWAEPDPDQVDPEAAAFEAAAKFAREVTLEQRRMQIREEARRRIARDERADLERPKMIRLDTLLATQFERPTYRIDHLWPSGGRMLCAAGWKAGKSTMVGNIIRALVDGDPFLGSFLPRQAHHVLLIDNELDPGMLQEWFKDQNITNTDRVTLLSLRGRVGTFDIIDPESRAEWAKEIAETGADVLILDCLRPILDAFGLDENHDAGRFLVPFDALLAESGTQEGAIIHHMGHGAERSRGDSRLLDWPDALWKIVRDKDEDDETGMDDPQGSRYFSAYGRDVDQGQVELLFDKPTRHLTLGTKTRHQATEHRKELRADQAILAAVEHNPGLNKNKLFTACRQYGIKDKGQVIEAVERLVEDGLILREIKGQGHFHYPLKDTETLPTDPNRSDSPGSVNQPLTWDYPKTDLETGGSGGSVTNQQGNGSGGSGGSVTDRSGTAYRSEGLKARGAVTGEQPPIQNPTSPQIGQTKPCEDCEQATIPTHHKRCPECSDRLIREAADHD